MRETNESAVRPRFKGMSAMGLYAETGICLAEESLELQKRTVALLEELIRLARNPLGEPLKVVDLATSDPTIQVSTTASSTGWHPVTR
jgi:hypothetical protein